MGNVQTYAKTWSIVSFRTNKIILNNKHFFDFLKNFEIFLSPSQNFSEGENFQKYAKSWFVIRFRRFWVDFNFFLKFYFSGEILDFGSLRRPYRKSVRQILWDLVLLVIDEHICQVWCPMDHWCDWYNAPKMAHLEKIVFYCDFCDFRPNLGVAHGQIFWASNF